MVPERVECTSLFVSLGVVGGRATLVVHDEVFFVGRLIVFREVGEIEAFVPFFVVAFFFGEFQRGEIRIGLKLDRINTVRGI